MTRILVVEDEAKIRESVCSGLAEEGYEVVGAANGEDGFYRASTERFDCVILDLMLPGRDGFQVLRDLRHLGQRVPIIVLTARGSVEDRVNGLDQGADDYMVKPFAFDELLARVRVCLRRGPTSAALVMTAGPLTLDRVRRRAFRGSREIELTSREFELLEYLMQHAGEVVSRDSIARTVWKEDAVGMTNGIEVYVSYLRRKIEIANEPPLLHTVRGVGYMLQRD